MIKNKMILMFKKSKIIVNYFKIGFLNKTMIKN
jgi:hypothetical protein